MRYAIIGGTHGNEPVGVRVCELLNQTPDNNIQGEYQTFIGNPESYKNKVRYIDSDLNRAFGDDEKPLGYEKSRSEEMRDLIEGSYEFIVDIHTTTSNMGITLILTNTHQYSIDAACYIHNRYPEVKLIASTRIGSKSPFITRLAPAGFIIEAGPVPNNVVRTGLVTKIYHIVRELLNYSYDGSCSYDDVLLYRGFDKLNYPKDKKTMIHPNIDNNDFSSLKNGDPVFIDYEQNEIMYEGRDAYPYFINEAAYQGDGLAMHLAEKVSMSAILDSYNDKT